LLLLDKCSQEQGDLCLLVLWRAWSIHNNVTHQSGNTSVSDSVFFLLNLRESLAQVRQQSEIIDEKGKASAGIQSLSVRQQRQSLSAGNLAPPDGWLKMNVDGSFVESSGEAGVGIVIRKSTEKNTPPPTLTPASLPHTGRLGRPLLRRLPLTPLLLAAAGAGCRHGRPAGCDGGGGALPPRVGSAPAAGRRSGPARPVWRLTRWLLRLLQRRLVSVQA